MSSASADAQAVELFRDGRRLLVSQQYVEACARFRQSLALKRSPGILLNVGDCLVRESEPARALETYEEALALAERAPDSPSRTAWLLDARREIDVLRRQLAAAAPGSTAAPAPVASPPPAPPAPPNVAVTSPAPAPSAPAQTPSGAVAVPAAAPVATPPAGSAPAEGPPPAAAATSGNGGAYALLTIAGIAAVGGIATGVASSQTAPDCRYRTCTEEDDGKKDTSSVLGYVALGCAGTAIFFGVLGVLQLQDLDKPAAAAARSPWSVRLGSTAKAPVLVELVGKF